MLQSLGTGRWNYSTAAHLLNRAGFGGPPAEIEALEALGLEQAVSRLVDYERVPDDTADPAWAKPDPQRMEKLRAARSGSPEERRRLQQEEQRAQREHILELRHWWLRRMASGKRPMQEKMVLFWHGHFATSVEKVRDAYLMWRQNELFRRLATGNWLDLLLDVAKDPAMLLYLDQAQSRKQHPNENFAREVMELFALGEGHYTEKDITEAARALTGWSYDRVSQKFIERPAWHDDGEKTIFHRSGRFDGKDFLELLVAQPEAARFITAKLWRFFAGTEPSEELLSEMAKIFRASGNQFKPVLRRIFLSENFYASEVMHNQVKSPVQWLVGSVRLLERQLPPALVASGLVRNLGQDLFAPPNVKGWDGGLSWITTNTLLARYNEAAVLVEGDLSVVAAGGGGKNPKLREAVARRARNLRLGGVEPEKLFSEEERSNRDALLSALGRRFLQSKLKPQQAQALEEYWGPGPSLAARQIVGAIRLVMSTPEYQLT